MTEDLSRLTPRQRETHARIEAALKTKCSHCDELAVAGQGEPPEWYCLQHLAERVEAVRQMLAAGR